MMANAWRHAAPIAGIAIESWLALPVDHFNAQNVSQILVNCIVMLETDPGNSFAFNIEESAQIRQSHHNLRAPTSACNIYKHK